jgi:hypothetical protein
MVSVQHSPVNQEHFPQQTPVAQELHAYEHVLYHVLSLTSSDFSALQYSIFHDALESYQLFLFYIESKPQPIRPLRSRRKMLYRELKLGQLNPEEVWEAELKISEGHSLLCAAIEGSRDNIPYLVERHHHARFNFGCILPQAAAFSPAGLLAELPGYLRPQSRLTRVDTPKLLQYLSAQQAHLIQLPSPANDDLRLSLFFHREDAVFSAIVSSIDQEYKLPDYN